MNKSKKSVQVLNKVKEQFSDQLVVIFVEEDNSSMVLLDLIQQCYPADRLPQIFKFILPNGKHRLENWIDNKEWQIKLVSPLPKDKQLIAQISDEDKKKKIMTVAKSNLINKLVDENKWQVVISSQYSGKKDLQFENYLFKKDDYIKVYPLLHFSEKEVYDYLNNHNLPMISSFQPRKKSKKQNDDIMNRLRKLGYWQ